MYNPISSAIAIEESTVFNPGEIYVADSFKKRGRGDHVFSNDGPIQEDLLDTIRSKKEGLMVAIGSGAVFSLIDYHELQPIIVDYDPVVIKIQKLVGTAILTTSNAKDAQEFIIEKGAENGIIGRNYLRNKLHNESAEHRLASIHWTKHFESVQESLSMREPAYVMANIQSKMLATSLRATADWYGDIKFFNPTNVHNHLRWDETSMNFLRLFPFSAKALVLYSDRRNQIYSSDNSVSLSRDHSIGLGKYLSFTKHAMKD